MIPRIKYSSAPVLQPQPGVPWADTMLLNPTLLKDPESDRLHMLFRATGPWPQAREVGLPLPYPIFLGYATSDDAGHTWAADFTLPALAPRLASREQDIKIRNRAGQEVVNYANGCVEDPRLFTINGTCYLTTACRMFPPGPYWEHDEPMQCAPAWAAGSSHSLGRAARENVTVTVLWEVNLPALRARRYGEAFVYITHLTDPEKSDNRDVFLLPVENPSGSRDRYWLLHRPFSPAAFGLQYRSTPPCIFLARANRIEDLPTESARQSLVAQPEFVWEKNRIGASWVPLPLDKDEWLIPYHGKQDNVVGYTQSFAIAAVTPNGLSIRHRCRERLMFAQQPWELAGRFKIPCLFTCGGIRYKDDLIMTYGAADMMAGVARVNFAELITYLRTFDANGRSTSG